VGRYLEKILNIIQNKKYKNVKNSKDTNHFCKTSYNLNTIFYFMLKIQIYHITLRNGYTSPTLSNVFKFKHFPSPLL